MHIYIYIYIYPLTAFLESPKYVRVIRTKRHSRSKLHLCERITPESAMPVQSLRLGGSFLCMLFVYIILFVLLFVFSAVRWFV